MEIPAGIVSFIFIPLPVTTERILLVSPMNYFLDKFPPTVDKVVDKLEIDMTFADKTRLANMNETALVKFHRSYGIFLRREFRLPGNDPLMKSCMSTATAKTMTPEQASYVILKELQKRLLAGNSLKVIKQKSVHS
jgi:hypothetical protein